MSYIPDCRADENYNQKYLKEKDKEFVAGFDWCVEMAVDNFFDNDMYELQDEDGYLGHILCEEVPESMQTEYEMSFTFNFGEDGEYEEKTETRIIKTYADLIRSKILEWIEMERDMLITSMIEGMDEDEYAQAKAKIDGQGETEN